MEGESIPLEIQAGDFIIEVNGRWVLDMPNQYKTVQAELRKNLRQIDLCVRTPTVSCACLPACACVRERVRVHMCKSVW